MSKEELNSVLDLIAQSRGEGHHEKPLWQIRGETDLIGLSLPMPEEVVEIVHVRLNGVPGLRFASEEAANNKAMLFMHGGGYVYGSPISHRHFAAKLAVETGLPVWSIDYRLAPEWAYPAAVDDAVAAYQGLLDQGMDANNIVIGGDSAGGGLAAALLIALKERGLPQPAGGYLLSPWVDLTQTSETYTSRAAVDPLVQKADLDQLSALYLRTADPKASTASPLFADLSGLAPIYIQVGDAETLLDDSLSFAERAKNAGLDVKLDHYPDMIHIWPYFWPMLSEGRDAIAKLADFCRARLNK